MAKKFAKVKPGELITAELFNGIIDALEALLEQTGTTPPGPTPSAEEKKGSIRAVISFKLTGKEQKKGGTDNFGVLLPNSSSAANERLTDSELANSVKVTATDKAGNSFTLSLDKTTRVEIKREGGAIVLVTANYVSGDLVSNIYLVTAKANGFNLSRGRVTVAPGKESLLSLMMAREDDSGEYARGKPRKPIDASGLEPPGWYNQARIVEKYLRWPWPPPEERPEFGDPFPVDDPTANEWGEWIQNMYPEAPVDAANANIYVSDSHDPENLPENAYAYLVFGENGCYMPVLLVPAGKEQEVPVVKSDLQIDSNKIVPFGLETVGEVAAAWSKLVSDALEIAQGSVAESVIKSARQQNLHDSVRRLGGVDKAVEEKLGHIKVNEKMMNSLVGIANAEPADLQGPELPLDFAERLVAEARQAVASDQWSVASEVLGFKESEVAALKGQGITTLGRLKTKLNSPGGIDAIAKTLSRTKEEVETIDITVKSQFEGIATADVKRSAVTGIFGVSRESGRKLAELGFVTIGSLAASGEAEVANIAKAFGGDMEKAKAVIKSARSMVIR